MNYKWTRAKINRLKEIVENTSSKKEGLAQAAEEFGCSFKACHHAYYKYIYKRVRNRSVLNTPKAVRIFRKNLKKYSGNLAGEAFPKIAESLNLSIKTIQNAYYGNGNFYKVCKCYRYNIKPSFCMLNLSNTFHRKNFNSDSAIEKHDVQSILKMLKSIFNRLFK
jgi:hypothetical protein